MYPKYGRARLTQFNNASSFVNALFDRTDVKGVADAITLTPNVMLGNQTVEEALANVTSTPSTLIFISSIGVNLFFEKLFQ